MRALPYAGHVSSECSTVFPTYLGISQKYIAGLAKFDTINRFLALFEFQVSLRDIVKFKVSGLAAKLI